MSENLDDKTQIEYEKKVWENVQEEKRIEAASYLNKTLPKNAYDFLNEAFSKNTDDYEILEDMPLRFHFEYGMAVRNELRSAGFGEEYFGIENLDFIYMQLLRIATTKIVRWGD